MSCQSHSVHVFDDARTVERNENTMMVILDEPVASKADVNALGIRHGDMISVEPRCQITPNGYLKSRFIDDKAAVACCFAALKYLKATGNHNMNSQYMKVFFWYNMIDNYYLQQGYQLTGDQGVEERLTKFAADNNIPLWEVESSLFQIGMMSGFSEELTVWMLEDIPEYTGKDSWEGTMDLFELWCSGDEAALRERISCDVDLTDATEEELAEYESYKHLLEEYNDSMSHDRNEGMLEVAIQYLESGETIFYAVGLAHLLDETNGLVDALRAAGYTVELVEFAQ
jgi:uncharacterized protein YbaP (TraB family)